jgi:hypothetical protein
MQTTSWFGILLHGSVLDHPWIDSILCRCIFFSNSSKISRQKLKTRRNCTRVLLL